MRSQLSRALRLTTVVVVPAEVSLRKVDLATELQILSFYQQHRRRALVHANAEVGGRRSRQAPATRWSRCRSTSAG